MPRPPGVAEHALRAYGSREIRFGNLFVPGAKTIRVAARVITGRRLKERVGNLNQISGGMAT
jgi:hypothetical protein